MGLSTGSRGRGSPSTLRSVMVEKSKRPEKPKGDRPQSVPPTPTIKGRATPTVQK